MATYPLAWQIQVVRHVDGPNDPYGNPTPAWADPVTRDVYGVAPASVSESYDPGRNAAEFELQVFGPAESLADVSVRDRVIFQDATYEVEGHPERYDFGPFGFAPGVRINLKRVEG